MPRNSVEVLIPHVAIGGRGVWSLDSAQSNSNDSYECGIDGSWRVILKTVQDFNSLPPLLPEMTDMPSSRPCRFVQVRGHGPWVKRERSELNCSKNVWNSNDYPHSDQYYLFPLHCSIEIHNSDALNWK
ncbi:hypothetical protein TNCV_2422571 [Trichonephila clavipes]|nr:hypothetical protein TNCV_2422571 [Trichonephila clavipes]